MFHFYLLIHSVNDTCLLIINWVLRFTSSYCHPLPAPPPYIFFYIFFLFCIVFVHFLISETFHAPFLDQNENREREEKKNMSVSPKEEGHTCHTPDPPPPPLLPTSRHSSTSPKEVCVTSSSPRPRTCLHTHVFWHVQCGPSSPQIAEVKEEEERRDVGDLGWGKGSEARIN